jgi:hypothetical protein
LSYAPAVIRRWLLAPPVVFERAVALERRVRIDTNQDFAGFAQVNAHSAAADSLIQIGQINSTGAPGGVAVASALVRILGSEPVGVQG